MRTEDPTIPRWVASAREGHLPRALVARLPEGPLVAKVDGLRLEQVLVNLLENAARHAPAGTAIDLELSEAADGVVWLAVRDRGAGVPAEHRERIFDRFYQVKLGSPVTGLGLGLYVCRQIVALHGGRVEVEAPDDGGARFVVTLPGEGSGERLGTA